MADLLVRNVPDDLHSRYKELARKHHRSLPAETIHLIEQAVTEDEQLERRRVALGRIATRRQTLPPLPHDAPDSLTMLREDRER